MNVREPAAGAGQRRHDHEAFFADADQAPVVLKIYRADDRFAAKEARALRFLTGHGLDISPRVLAFSKSASALGGRSCLVSSLRPGRTLAELDDELTCAQRHELYRQVGEVLKRLHAIPADGYGDVNGRIRETSWQRSPSTAPAR